MADNRTSGRGIISRFGPRGFDVLAYDSRAHGESDGDICTYVHGADDADTPPEHARRTLAALGGPKRLILVPGAGHNQSLGGTVWTEIERWLDDVLAAPMTPTGA